jgi:hypothetical protein
LITECREAEIKKGQTNNIGNLESQANRSAIKIGAMKSCSYPTKNGNYKELSDKLIAWFD